MKALKIRQQLTPRTSNSVEQYLKDIAKIEMISVEEEILLSEQIRNGNNAALERLVNANLRFVVSVAKQYQNNGLSLPDLINEGNIGLMKAARRFDATKGFKFISYAVWWIRQNILHAISENRSIIKLPANKINTTKKIKKTFSELSQQFEREPTIQEVAEALALDDSLVKDLLKSSEKTLFLEAPISNNQENLTILDIISIDSIYKNEIIENEIKNQTTQLLEFLNEIEKEVIKKYFGIDYYRNYSLTEIANEMESTKERIRVIKNKALVKLRKISKSKRILNY